MHDKQNVSPLSIDEITTKIIATAKWRNEVVDFVQQLEKHGILKMFMNGDSLDKLNSKLNDLQILVGPYAKLDYRGEMLIRYYESHFCHQVARQIAAVGATTDEEIDTHLKSVIELWQTPKHASDLFLAMCDLPIALRKVYQAAIDDYFEKKYETGLYVVSQSDNMKKISNYWETLSESKKEIFKLLDHAMPLGIEDSEETEAWISNHEDEFCKVDFSAARKLTDFDTVYKIFFGRSTTTQAGFTRAETKLKVYQSYKALVLKDCLTEIPDSDAQTGKAITNVLKKKAKDEPLRFIIRFIQAFFMFYREDARLVRERTRRSIIQSMPTLHNGGTINIPN